MNSFDLTQLKVIAAQDVESAGKSGAKELLICEGAILTPSAQEVISRYGMTVTNRGGGAAAKSGGSEWDKLFHSPEAETIKAEIVNVGRKLWMRSYVDGNGGNISYRLTNDAVLCTPTLVSKADLRPEDLCLVDMSGKQLAGGRPRTSEILMHLEIYKAVPEAKAVVHCHPPHATAYAITGRVPPTCVIPEYEVFVGKVALSPYETPGTQKFAETVVPYVKSHNTVLLSNHGIVCWADSVTHAEWYAEVVDTYCWTLMLTKELAPLSHISDEKAGDLLALKQRLGLPDARLNSNECPMCEFPEYPGGISLPGNSCAPQRSALPPAEFETIVTAVTEAVLAALEKKVKA